MAKAPSRAWHRTAEPLDDRSGPRDGPGAPGRWPKTVVGLLFGLGGVPALIDQVAWQRILALHSGVGAFSVTMIVAAYMAGLGVGSQVGGRLSRRLSPRTAIRAFAAVELGIGTFAWFSGSLYHELPGLDRAWFHGNTWRVGVGHFLALLPPTVLMGMTLPLLVRALARDAAGAPRLIGELYGLNLIGAAVGALAAPWLLIPHLGIVGALRAGSVCNLLGAVGVLALGRLAVAPGIEEEAVPIYVHEISGGGDTARGSIGPWAVLYFISGFYAVALEVVWFRVIDVGVKSTAFTFGTVLAVYLAGLALGSLAGSRLAGRLRDPLGAFLACQCAILLYTGLAVVLLAKLPPDLWVFDWYFTYWGAYEPVAPRWADLRTALALYAVFPAALFGLPTVLMGLSFVALQRGVQDEARTSGYKVGVLQSANIAGCVAGALVVGLWWLASPGTSLTLRGMVGTGGLLAALATCRAASRGRGARLAVGFTLALTLALPAVAALMPDQEALWSRLHGQRDGRALVGEGVAGVAALTPEGGERWRMSVNGKGQSFLPFGGVHSKLGALPAVLHPAPERIAIIGLGSGDTAWAAACRPETRFVSVFETCAIQLPLLRRLNGRAGVPRLGEFLRDPRVEVLEADGRAALSGGVERYDLIEADAIRPNGAYSGNLYSLEFFRICAGKLKPGGLMCSWSPTKRTSAGFRRVFPYVVEIDGGVILIGSVEPISLDLNAMTNRLLSGDVARYLGPDVLAECLASVKTARRLPAGASLLEEVNTDLFPRDEYQSPIR